MQPGEFVEVGQTYAQIESMKMVFDVVTKIVPGRLDLLREFNKA